MDLVLENDLGAVQGNQAAQTGEINIKINVKATPEVQIDLSIDRACPFYLLKNYIIIALFGGKSHRMFRSQLQYEEELIEYILRVSGGSSTNISASETRSLDSLGFRANSILELRFKLKGGLPDIKIRMIRIQEPIFEVIHLETSIYKEKFKDCINALRLEHFPYMPTGNYYCQIYQDKIRYKWEKFLDLTDQFTLVISFD